MEKIFKYLNGLHPYAFIVLHFVGGILVTVVSWWILRLDPWVCFGFGMVAGLAKEIYDLYYDGHPSWLDWFITIAGALSGTGLIIWL